MEERIQRPQEELYEARDNGLRGRRASFAGFVHEDAQKLMNCKVASEGDNQGKIFKRRRVQCRAFFSWRTPTSLPTDDDDVCRLTVVKTRWRKLLDDERR